MALEPSLRARAKNRFLARILQYIYARWARVFVRSLSEQVPTLGDRSGPIRAIEGSKQGDSSDT